MKKNRFETILLVGLVIWMFIGCKVHILEPIINIDIPLIENFTADGNPEEWGKIASYRLWSDPLGIYPEPSDLEAYMKIAWSKSSLHLMLEVTDNNFVGDTLNLKKGDAIEVFLSPFRGSENIIQISISPFSGKDFVKINDLSKNNEFRNFVPEIKSFSQFRGHTRVTEIEIGFLMKVPEPGRASNIALQVYVSDADSGIPKKNQLVWYPVGQSHNSSSSMFTVNLTKENNSISNGSSRLLITDNEKLNLYVFGASAGDKIGIYRNGEFLRNYKSYSKSIHQPDSFDITSPDWDIENDSLFVTLNGESLCFHELFLAPRLYNKLKEKRFERDIRNFIYNDRLSFPPENATLFIGSSSIVRWKTLKNDFPELQIIQRGFGGSTSPDAFLYINQIVLPYKPAKIVYYEGDNDIPMGFSPEEIRSNIKAFIEQVSISLPETKVFLLSPKPSIKRMFLWEKYKNTHAMLRELSDEYANVKFVDVSSPMFNQNGKLNYSLFTEDGIHMNEAGYEIWTKVIRKALELD